MSASSLPQCSKCGNDKGPWRPRGGTFPSGEQLLVCSTGCPAGVAEAVAELGALPMPVGDPLAYGPTGYRCGCGKNAHSNLTPCRPDPPLEAPAPGALAEQRHLVDPLDHVLEHLADERPTVTS